jgi:hypothetical protein
MTIYHCRRDFLIFVRAVPTPWRMSGYHWSHVYDNVKADADIPRRVSE